MLTSLSSSPQWYPSPCICPLLVLYFVSRKARVPLIFSPYVTSMAVRCDIVCLLLFCDLLCEITSSYGSRPMSVFFQLAVPPGPNTVPATQ